MKVARPPVFVNVHLGPSALVALLSRVALFGARNGWLRLGGATLSEPGSRRVATGRVLERLSPPPGEMFSPLYGTGRTTLCAMSAPVQEKQAALSQLPARLLPPAVRASPRAVRAKIVGLAQAAIAAFGSHSSTGGASRLGETRNCPVSRQQTFRSWPVVWPPPCCARS